LPNQLQLKHTYNANGYLESVKAPKEQIGDFDESMFDNLLVDNTIKYKDKMEEIKSKIRELHYDISRYQKHIDNYSNKSEEEINNKIKDYEEVINRYDDYIDTYSKIYAQYNTISGNYYRLWIKHQNSYLKYKYRRLFYKYSKISSRYSYTLRSFRGTQRHYKSLLNNFLVIDEYKKTIIANRVQINRLKNDYINYRNLLKNLLETDISLKSIYQTISDDSNYAYFYQALEMNPYGQVSKYLDGTGMVTQNSYDISGRLSHIQTGFNQDNPIRELHFTYDTLNNLKNREDKMLGVSQNFTYDNLNRISMVDTTTKIDSTTLSMEYDILGNIIHKSDVGEYTYDPAKPHQVIKAGTKTYEYDENGNMIKRAN
jgi:hypothetical protein